MESGKAPGTSGMTPDLLKYLDTTESRLETILHSKGKRTKTTKIQNNIVINLIKNGERLDPKNYKSMCMLEVEGKLLWKTMKERLDAKINKDIERKMVIWVQRRHEHPDGFLAT